MSVVSETLGRSRRVVATPAIVSRSAVVVVGLFLVSGLGDYGSGIVVDSAATAVVVAGLHVLVHWAGQVSLGQVAFVGIGAFVAARANAEYGVPLPMAVVAGTMAGLVAAIPVGLPALRLKGFALAIATLAFGFAAERWLFLQTWLVPQSAGVPLADRNFLGAEVGDTSALALPVVVIALAVVFLVARFGDSPVGMATRLVAHDGEVAASYGVNGGTHKLLAFAIAGACAGLGGALTLVHLGRVGPSAFPTTESILYLSAVLLGGPGSVWGSVVAAVGFTAFPVLAGGLGHYISLIGPLAILMTVTTAPGGLNGQGRDVKRLLVHARERFGRRHLNEEDACDNDSSSPGR